jgi:hypothetical protein
VKIRGERVEDLIGAHVGVGVDDTLAAALHVAGCEGSGNAMASVRVDYALALRPMLAGLGERFSRFNYGCPFRASAHNSPPSGLRMLVLALARADLGSPRPSKLNQQLIDVQPPI